MKKILFDRIDEPGLNTLAVYERRGGYGALRKALAMSPQEVLDELLTSAIRGRGGDADAVLFEGERRVDGHGGARDALELQLERLNGDIAVVARVGGVGIA